MFKKNHLAVLKAALEKGPAQSLADAKRALLERHAADLSEWQIVLLAWGINPAWPEGTVQTGLMGVLRQTYPDLGGENAPTTERLWHDLFQRGLVLVSTLDRNVTRDGGSKRCTSQFGEELLNLIRNGG